MQKILNMPVQYLILDLAGFVAVLSVVVPVILKLTKKKDENFRTLFLGCGMLMAFFILALASFIALFNINFNFFLGTLSEGMLILAGLGLLERFIDWILKD